MNVAVLVNQSANNHQAGKKWETIREEILSKLPINTEVIEYRVPIDIKAQLRLLLDQRRTDCIISAGGDGSMNHILNALIEEFEPKRRRIFLGAIGLGSSNDLLKPCSTFIKGIPVKINLETPKPTDVGKIVITGIDDGSLTRYFIANASIGVTADANLFFNEGDGLLNWLKPRNVGLAIYYAALKTILTYKNKIVRIQHGNMEFPVLLSNLSVVKNPNISGSLRYDQTIRPDDGMLGLNYCHDMNKIELIGTLYDLQKGKFSGKPKRMSALIKNLRISSDALMALETDGEVIMARTAEFSVLPGLIELLSC